MKPGSDISYCCANSVTVQLPSPSCDSTPRRVESDSAAKIRSSWESLYLTIRYSIVKDGRRVKRVLNGRVHGGKK